MRDEALAALRALNETVERLRAPGGCPWDREQTHRTLRPYLLEETYEVLEAIESDHAAELREELGDLLLQVLMHSAIAQERDDGFDIGDVAEVVRAKMVNRHPHVFGDVQVSGAGEVVVNWERLKAAEKGRRLSILEGVPQTLPALAYALGVQKRPARLGFDETPTRESALARLRAALDEVAQRAEEAAASATTVPAASPPPAGHAPGPPPPPPELEAAVGDLLFAVVALSRRLRVNPEDALRARAHRFADRFRRLEASARERGDDLHGLEAAEWEARWSQSEA